MIRNYLFYFLIYAFIGWCAEVVYAALTTGKFVNRGYLSGPYCPIYGFGSIFVLMSLYNLKDNKILLFLGSVIITTILEFLVGWFLEKVFHQSFWDYSDRPFNIKGYVCLQFSIMWGIGCMFIIDYLHPTVELIYHIIPSIITTIFLIAGTVSILVDTIISTNSILKLNRELKRLHEISNRLKEISDDLGEGLAKTFIDVKKNAEETKDRIEALREERRVLLKDRKEKIAKNSKKRRRMIKALPSWIHREFQNELEELKERFQ